MVLRLKQFFRQYGLDIVMIFLLTCVLMYPYLIRGFLPVEHDTFFHISRIEQLSKAIRSGQFLPGIYPDENFGYGYASPLFYCDFFLMLPSLLHLAGVSVALCYRLTVFAASLISGLTMFFLALRISRSRPVSFLTAGAYLFSNYRITDIYVRGALGEIFAFAALPAIINALYRILQENDENGWYGLALSLGSLALCHNLSFALGAFLVALLVLLHIRSLNQKKIIALCKGIGFAFGISAFYTLPMLEQVSSQSLVVDYYGSSSNLSAYSIDFWQYFANRTVFALAGNSRAVNDTMLVNIGYFLEFLPLSYLAVKKEKRSKFVMILLATGYLFILLPSSLLPWESFTFLRILQFPWRLNTLGMVLLAVPAAMGTGSLLKKKGLITAILMVLCAECIWHVSGDLSRTFGMDDSMTWQDVLDGALCDPCYSADYVRVELAGGDYLPWPHPDYRTLSDHIIKEDGTDAGIEYTRSSSWMRFEIEEDLQETMILPLTWYKGYHVYKTDGEITETDSFRTADGLLAFKAEGNGTYLVLFEDTPLRRMCMSLSIISLVFMVMLKNGMPILWFRKKA